MAPRLSDLHFGLTLRPIHRMSSQQAGGTHSVVQYTSSDSLGAVDIFGMVEWFEPGPILSGGQQLQTIFLSSGAADDPLFTQTTQVLRDIIIVEQAQANLSGQPFRVVNQWTPPTIDCPAPLSNADKLEKTPFIALEHTEACKASVYSFERCHSVRATCLLYRGDSACGDSTTKTYSILLLDVNRTDIPHDWGRRLPRSA